LFCAIATLLKREQYIFISLKRLKNQFENIFTALFHAISSMNSYKHPVMKYAASFAVFAIVDIYIIPNVTTFFAMFGMADGPSQDFVK
jgi:hypothetical protein